MIIEPTTDDPILRRKERDLQRQRIDNEMYDEQKLQQILQISEREAIELKLKMNAISNTNEMANENSESISLPNNCSYKYCKSDKAELSDDDDGGRDGKKEMMDGLLHDTDDDDEDYNVEDEYNESVDDVRVMRGILGRRVDWVPGEVISDEHRTQYLVLWEDSTEPVWEFSEDLQGFYSREMDEFEDNDMEDEWEEDQRLLNIRTFTVRYEDENNCNSNTNSNV